MKKLSKIINKSHITFILIALFVFTLSLFYTMYFIIKDSKADLLNTRTFLLEELDEEDHNDIDFFFDEVLKEGPKADKLDIVLVYKNKIYQEKETPNISFLNLSSKIQKLGFFDYYIIHDKTLNNLGEEIEFIIIRELASEKNFLKQIIIIYFTGSFFIIIFSLYTSKYFYNKIIPPLSRLEEITNEINLSSFEYVINKNQFFEEFYNILTSYEEMLKRLEKQTNSQIEFVHNASHELKTPIFVISGYIDLIKRWGIHNQQVSDEALDFIQEETKNMTILVEKLLFLAKQEKIEINKEKVELKDLIEEIINEFKIINPHQDFYLNLKDLSVYSDESLLKQLIRNIIDNAIKYGQGNKISLVIKFEKNITLTVTDRGIGIPKNELDKIFDKFFRSDRSRNKEFGGHGLGLAIVKQITDALNGSIKIESTLGEGTSVTITLPYLLEK